MAGLENANFRDGGYEFNRETYFSCGVISNDIPRKSRPIRKKVISAQMGITLVPAIYASRHRRNFLSNSPSYYIPSVYIFPNLFLNMEFVSNLTSSTFLASMDLNSQDFQSPVTIGLAGFIATLLSLLAYMSYSLQVDKRSPAFTPDTVPFIGSWRFFTQKL
jgi:hypothetical protein